MSEPIERKSWRLDEFAQRHGFSRAFIYKEIGRGSLPARKAGAATIITDEDEAAWLTAMPSACNTETEAAHKDKVVA
jgi:hypothetical protein